MTTTVIRNAAWAVGWDKAKQAHVYLRDVDVAWDGGTITHVGKGYEGPADTEIDGRERLVLPGFVNIHSHPTSEPLRKGITDETRSFGFHHSSLYEFLTVFLSDRDGAIAAMEVALAELLLSGVSTLADLSMPFEGWMDILADSGMRACIAPMFKDARWYTTNGHSLDYDWDTGAGTRGFENARLLIDRARQHPSGRLSGMLCPAQIDTCTPELLRDSHDYAQERNLPYQIHAAQSVTEFREMVTRHGRTPIQWMDDLGILDDKTIIGHGIFLDHHPWLHWTTREDLKLLADRQATVAHCPTVFLRRGITLRTFGEYGRNNINLGLGTDTYPHNFLDEMRNAAYAARIAAGSVDDLTTTELFNAATIGGARALRMDDIGRLAPGMKADILTVDIRHPSMRPLREPVRSLIYVAHDRAVHDLFIDGHKVVDAGRCLTIDLDDASGRLEQAQQRMMKDVPSRDWAGRTTDQMAPMVFDMVEGLQ